MLTTTYSIMVLHDEQQKCRSLVSGLQQHLDAQTCSGNESADIVWLKQAFAKLVAAYTYCRQRKVERFVIPTVKEIAHDASTLFSSLDFYASYGRRIIEYVHGEVQRAVKGIQVDASTLIAAMQLYCKQMADRLLLEDETLLPLARRLLSEDEWFQIASHCLSQGRQVRCRCYQLHALKRRRPDQRLLH
jgi:DUF438 domain-containing protein